jgi:hypothetical protein
VSDAFDAALKRLPRYMRDTDSAQDALREFWRAAQSAAQPATLSIDQLHLLAQIPANCISTNVLHAMRFFGQREES